MGGEVPLPPEAVEGLDKESREAKGLHEERKLLEGLEEEHRELKERFEDLIS